VPQALRVIADHHDVETVSKSRNSYASGASQYAKNYV
jgi:hypothetical protein